MVSLGTILTIGIIGAAAAGAYAVYSNLDKIGGAFTRTTEAYISNPLGDWLDSLSKTIRTSTGTAPGQPGQGINPGTIWNPLPPAYGGGSTKPAPVPVPTYNNPALPPSFTNPPTSNLPQPIPVIPPTQVESSKPTVQAYESFKEGYYYINYTGSKYDTQWKLSARKAWEVARAAIAPGDALLGIQYIGQSKLGEKGFQIFGKSQNYL